MSMFFGAPSRHVPSHGIVPFRLIKYRRLFDELLFGQISYYFVLQLFLFCDFKKSRDFQTSQNVFFLFFCPP